MMKIWALLIVMSLSALACTDAAENEPTAADESTSTAASDDNGAPDLVLSEPTADPMTDGDALAPLAFNEDCTPDQALWADAIEPVVSKFCGDCHGETTQFGAPISFADYTLLFGGPEGKRPIDGLVDRLIEGTMPPPSQPQPGAQNRADVLDWATCGTWRKGTDELPNPGGAFDADRDIIPQSDPPMVGVDFFELRAQAFKVGPDEDDRYECFTFELPITEERFIRRIETVVGDARVLHHAILIPEGQGEPGTHGPCDEENPLSLVYGWAPGQGALQFPEGGIRIRPGQRMTLNIHYNNSAGHGDVRDSSGVRIYHAPTEGPEVSMLTIGPLGFRVPGGQSKKVNGWCQIPNDTKMLYSFPHMHETGTAFETVLVKPDGSESSVITLDGWEFDAQYVYETPLDLPKGTILRTACTYRNEGDKPVRFGPNTGDEMCFNFTYISPPIPVTFCNQNEPPLVLSYEPGDCAPTGADALEWIPVTAGVVDGTPPPLNGGGLSDGLWPLTGGDIYLESASLGGFEVDLEASRVTALGSMGIAENRIAFDVTTEIHVVADGVAFDVVRPFSFAGTFDLERNDSVSFTVEKDCGEVPTDDPIEYEVDDETIKLKLPIRFGPVAFQVLFVF